MTLLRSALTRDPQALIAAFFATRSLSSLIMFPLKPPSAMRPFSVRAGCSILRKVAAGRVDTRLYLCSYRLGRNARFAQVWPDVPQVLWPELWVRPEHGGYGFDPTLPPVDLGRRLEHLSRNTLTAAALQNADAWVMPTQHQARSLPPTLRDHRLHVIHEGIDTQLAKPNPEVTYEVMGHHIDRSVPTITFVNRNLERLRGFDLFMRSLPQILRCNSRVRVLIVGDGEAGYGGGHPSGKPIRQVMQEELAAEMDWTRLHFLGRIPHPQLIGLMQASWVHVYLSYPFVLGWSALEAMACGCCMVGSTGMPVEELLATVWRVC